ncbi:E3 ubiquitin-protein ligase COP1-like isoform X1 [Amblyomma americanum]|uniref:RING-type domain-containing protein n=1 Tax=Amblyomma americanum TaxID=6943 RepID=A0AAQ4FB84_AMBAM
MASANNTRISIADHNRRARKRQPSVLNGISSSYEDRNSDFLCPICFDIIEEAHMTPCGHTFCFKCITTGLEYNNRCPKCNFVVEKKEQIYPNFLLNELITKYKQRAADKKMKLQGNNQVVSELHELIVQESDNMSLNDVYNMLDVLSEKKQQLEADCKAAQAQLLKEFLEQVRKHKQEQMDQLTTELSFIDEDLKSVEENAKDPEHFWLVDSGSHLPEEAAKPENPTSMQDGFNGSKYGSKPQWLQSTLASRRKRVHLHFDDLEECYLTTRTKHVNYNSADGLKEFTEDLSKFTRYSSIRPLATLNYATDLLNGTSIVSSIEFDKDNEFFAIAGVTKKIKVFEYGTVIQDIVDIHYPVNEMMCNSKISCISWSSYHKGMLASSDYEGTVTIWDAFTGQKVKMFQEHEKRCWSVDFNKVDTKIIASGSDDAKVKLWSIACDHSVISLEAKANVCCVKFNPASRFHLALGSADHCVYYYDLRSTKEPLCVFKGHKKAVSYVKFLNTNELVSASTDSQLKLWDIYFPYCQRSFKGHLNEKNFVGLATDGDYVACGSENNALYIYYKGLSKQVLKFRFDVVRNILEKDKREEDSSEFVSAVCWRMGSSVVVAANSQGTIKVLELV